MPPRKINGKWYADKWITHPDGRRERIRKKSPINNKRGAEEYERQVIEEMLMPSKINHPKEKRFGKYFEEFLEDYAITNNGHREYDSKKSIGQKYLIPFFGRMLIHQIDKQTIEKFKKNQKKLGLMVPTINNQLSVLSMALREAVDCGYLNSLPHIKRLKEAKPPIDYLNFSEVECLIESAESEMLSTMFVIAARAGLRLGEIIALTKKNVKLDEGEIVVCQAISNGILGPTKDSDTRYIPISENTTSVIRSYIVNRGKDAFHEFVFCNSDGKPVTPNQLKRPVLRAFKASGLDAVGRRWKVLRHTFASHCFMWGIPPEWVQQWLGHSDTKTTMRYAHLQRRYFEGRMSKEAATNKRSTLPWEISNRWEAIALLDQPPPWTAQQAEGGATVTKIKIG